MSKSKIAALGASAIALGATAYYFLGPEGEKHQRSAKKWMVDAKKKIIQEVKKGEHMSESMYGNIVDNMVMPYMKKGAATAKEIGVFAQDLKRDWKHIVKAAQGN